MASVFFEKKRQKTRNAVLVALRRASQQGFDPVDDKLRGQGGQHDAENFGNDGIDRFADDSGQPCGGAEQSVVRQQNDGKGEDDHHLTENVAVMGAHQQNDRRDRPRSGNQRNGKREDGDIVRAFGFVFGRVVFVFFAENHLQPDDEQHDPARDAERGQ